jgi:hypothetical protein
MLDRLESFRARLAGRFEATPWELVVVVHPRPAQLALAHPWVPLLRAATAPAGRRYLAGSFTHREIHVLSPRALAARASAAPGSREALELSPLHEYAHVVLGLNNPGLPPPARPASVRAYLRWAWLCEGAATHLSGQSRFLGAAVARRLREGPPPAFPPDARDALVLGGSVFDLLEASVGPDACTALARSLDPAGAATGLERAFRRPLRAIEGDWRDHLRALASG